MFVKMKTQTTTYKNQAYIYDQSELARLKIDIFKIIFLVLLSNMILGSNLKIYFKTFQTNINNIYSPIRVKMLFIRFTCFNIKKLCEFR